MRALIVGTDFAYDKNGKLRPIEINTNTALQRYHVEDREDIFDLSEMKQFIIDNKFTKITYIGALHLLSEKIEEITDELDIQYEFVGKGTGVAIPFIEDDDSHLILRSSYDNTAIVDEEYCKVKSNFLNLIGHTKIGSQFAYIDESGSVYNTINEFPDNGNHPNFILKAIYPQYDRDDLPKLYRITTQKQLDNVVNKLDSNSLLMEFHYNPEKLYENHMIIIRSFNMLFPPDLDNLPLGQHYKLTGREIDEESKFNKKTGELQSSDRSKYLTSDASIRNVKLLDDDRVEMADGTTKKAIDLNEGDEIKTIKIANPNEISLKDDNANFKIDYKTFISGSTYTTNKITGKKRIDKLAYIYEITFTDGTTWSDTDNSRYLIVRNNEVRFMPISQNIPENRLEPGDEIILIDTSKDDTLTPILKKVKKIKFETTFFSGWEIDVDETNIFLTQNEEGQSFAAIEHNIEFCVATWNCVARYDCPKSSICCYGTCF